MRMIKFRGRCAFSGVWRYGFYYVSKGNHIIRNENDRESIVLEKTIGRFTGLHDKNGKEIYEGDILNVGENLVCEIVYVDKNVEDYGDEIHCAFHAKVYIHNKTIPLDSYLKNNCEIIGSIYENPELLENKLAD